MKMRIKPLDQQAAEFWSMVDKSAGPEACWPWTGKLSPSGYGLSYMVRGHYAAHRAAYLLTNGPFELSVSGSYVCHTCDQPSCCNPSHLYAGNALTNTRDIVLRARRYPPPVFESEAAEVAALELRTARWSAGLTQDQVACALGLQISFVNRVERGREPVTPGLTERWMAACRPQPGAAMSMSDQLDRWLTA